MATPRIKNMIYGRATVEVVMDRRNVFGREIVEENALGQRGLVWVKCDVRHFVNDKNGGYVMDEVTSAGSAWFDRGNVRNFVRSE